MKTTLVLFTVLIGFGFASSITPAHADADDVAWINKCVKDNAKEGASADVTGKWCTCMNNKMSSSETQSITQWEKTHKTERDACSKQAGWN